MDVRLRNPHTDETGARGANVVIHLPARPETVRLVRRADRLDHFAPNQVTKIRQAVERRQRSGPVYTADGELLGDPGNLVGRVAPRVQPLPLLVPAPVRGGTRETVRRIGRQPGQQPLEPRPRDQRSTLEQQNRSAFRLGDQPVEAGRRSL
jgi:hypothetical protein